MLVHPYDSAMSEQEWRDWIASGSRFGILTVAGITGEAPIMVPTHFTLLETEVVIHLHKANSAISAMRTGGQVSFMVMGDYAFIPGQWRAKDPDNLQDGVPTSYYAAVQFACEPRVIDDPESIVEILKMVMNDFQPDGGYAEVSETEAPYGPLVNSIRGVRMKILSVDAKFKYDDHKSIEFREAMIARLLERNQGLDVGAAQQQRRRLNLLGEWNREAK